MANIAIPAIVPATFGSFAVQTTRIQIELRARLDRIAAMSVAYIGDNQNSPIIASPYAHELIVRGMAFDAWFRAYDVMIMTTSASAS